MTQLIDKPRYIQLYENILEKIENKKFDSDYQLPSENEFAKEFNVNRHTVRQALQLLKDEGYIYTKKGKGNFIANIKLPYKITDKSNYSSQILDLGYEPNTKFLSAEIIKGSNKICKALELKRDSEIIELKLLRFANELPISISISYFDALKFHKILDYKDIKPFSLYKVLSICYKELEITKESTIFEALMPTLEEAKLLLMPQSNPVLSTTTISRDQFGNIVEYGQALFRADMCKVKVDLI
ncbi:hypothetical protein CRU99_11720 [Malaciobacter mytili]|uniref:GntR family transcriptional regulator n=1 Tax=Malaciobacter mytili TaxID=603050 RepID=UPI00100BCC53|nr:GntR family transcriptional regulator [Malaciobacter mytili]RXI37558.1 hypothetical protein CRU99_11720 [Malaciobacter mytili]